MFMLDHTFSLLPTHTKQSGKPPQTEVYFLIMPFCQLLVRFCKLCAFLYFSVIHLVFNL